MISSNVRVHAEIDKAPLSELLRKAFGKGDLPLEPMPGGASTRRYFRVAVSDTTSAVAMFVPDGSTPEEIQKGGAHARWPFLEVRDLLEERGVAVPRVLGEDTDSGWLLLEDLGDDTLANYLLRSPQTKRELYTSAVTDLARAQQSLSKLPQGCVVASRAFDADLLKWEIDHFREWGVEARGHAFSKEDAAQFDEIGKRLAQRVAEMPRGFTHRDYQSRNLMVREEGEKRSLVWIDFQDALLGPRVYDLVALLNDSYQEFDRPFVETRLDEFAKAAGANAEERKRIGLEFDLVTVQRKLKDAGRFVFIDRTKKNSSFLKFVTPTIHKVRDALSRLSEDADMAALHAILKRTLPEEF